MIDRDALVRLGPDMWEVPATSRRDMRVPARIFADEQLLSAMLEGEAITQLQNVATLPGLVDRVCGMPDMHEGYGFPVGGVAAMRMSDGVVSPGGVGFDINCGVRLLATPLTRAAIAGSLEALVHEISRSIPSGTGRGGSWSLDDEELDAVLVQGSGYLVHSRGFGTEEDLSRTESAGCIAGADPHTVSPRAKDRGRDQLGSMGSGNHFVELQVVDEVVNAPAAAALGLAQGSVTALIHTGSRGLGHQVCTDYVRRMDAKLSTYGIVLPDRQLSCAPIDSPEGREYLAAMACAANFAWANRQLIAYRVRRAIVAKFPAVSPESIRLVYDVAHNIAKVEEHGGERLCVHRKGATRAFGPGHPELPAEYQALGQPVFIPGSMGTASWILLGGRDSEALSWGSACHGAGRSLSRTAAKRQVSGPDLRKQLEAQGIVVRCASSAGLAEEAPFAYKDVDRVAAVVDAVGIASRVARLRPIGVIKGG